MTEAQDKFEEKLIHNINETLLKKRANLTIHYDPKDGSYGVFDVHSGKEIIFLRKDTEKDTLRVNGKIKEWSPIAVTELYGILERERVARELAAGIAYVKKKNKTPASLSDFLQTKIERE